MISCFECNYNMNDIINKLLLAGDNFMPEMHLKQRHFTYSACGPFTKNKERIQKSNKLEVQNIITEMNEIKPVFNMIWVMEILKTYQKEQLLIKF